MDLSDNSFNLSTVFFLTQLYKYNRCKVNVNYST